MDEERIKESMSEGMHFTEFVPQLIGAIILFLISIFMFFSNIVSTVRYINYIQIEAKIIDIKYDDRTGRYIPTYEYEYNNEVITVEGAYFTEEGTHEIGDRVTINFNPKNYKQYETGSKDSIWMSWFICIICLFISGIFLYRVYNTIRGIRALKYRVQEMIRNSQDEDLNDN